MKKLKPAPTFWMICGIFLINLLVYPISYFLLIEPGYNSSSICILYMALRIILCALLAWYVGGGMQWRAAGAFKPAISYLYKHYGIPIVVAIFVWFLYYVRLHYTIFDISKLIWNPVIMMPNFEVRDHVFRLFFAETLAAPNAIFAYLIAFIILLYRRAEKNICAE